MKIRWIGAFGKAGTIEQAMVWEARNSANFRKGLNYCEVCATNTPESLGGAKIGLEQVSKLLTIFLKRSKI